MNIRWIVGLGCLVLCASVCAAGTEPVSIAVSVDQSEIHIGEPIRYTIKLNRLKDIEVNWPSMGSAIGEFVVEHSGSEPAKLMGDRVVEGRWWQLAIYSTGSRRIPEPVATYRAADGTDHEARGQAVTITVNSLLPQDWESQDIRGVKPLVAIRRVGWWVWVLAVLVVIGVASGAWWLKRNRHVSGLMRPPRSPYEIAIEELDRLRQDELPSKNRYEEYYVRLSGIVRSYIEARFSVRASEMTTEEFLQTASQGQSLSFTHRALLQDFLAQCDLVKFARHQPTSHEAGEAFNAAQRFAQETIPPPAYPPKADQTLRISGGSDANLSHASTLRCIRSMMTRRETSTPSRELTEVAHSGRIQVGGRSPSQFQWQIVITLLLSYLEPRPFHWRRATA